LQEVAGEGTVRDFAGRVGEHVGKVTEKDCRGSHRGRYLNGAKFVADPFRFWTTCGNQTLVGLRVRKGVGEMKAFQMELPPEVSEEEARLLLAIKLYELGRLSLGQSAKLAGYSKRAFIELLEKYGVPVVAYSPEELREEVEG
jgi:predicted HTH domain antitoxin